MNIKRILIIANHKKPEAKTLALEMQSFLNQREILVDIVLFADQEFLESDTKPDLVITLGGDGTVLYAARKVAPILLYPLNLGNVGFITAFSRNSWQSDLQTLFQGGFDVVERLMICFALKREGTVVQKGNALNDVVISGSGISKLVNLIVHIDDSERIEYRADGIIFSTATGSTAYSAAAGGPILHPEIAAIILNPICPFTLSHRPLVLPKTVLLRVEVLQSQRADLMLTVDGQVSYGLLQGDEMVIQSSEVPARILYTENNNFYDVLRTKLNWAGGSE